MSEVEIKVAAAEARTAPGTVVFINTRVETISIGETDFIQDPYTFGEICFQCFFPCCVEVKYTGHDGNKTVNLNYGHGCFLFPCCYNWAASIESNGVPMEAGTLTPAGCCDNGVVGCMCPCLKTGTVVQMKFMEADVGPTYSTRADLGCIDCFYKCLGYSVCQLFTPCGYCKRFLDDTPYRIKEMPFYGENGVSVEPEDGKAPAGHFVFVEQLKPIGCCCIPTGVRSNIKMAPGQQNPSTKQIALLALYTEIAKGLPFSNPCALACMGAAGVPVPYGHSWTDVGMAVNTQWVNIEGMNAITAMDPTAPVYQQSWA